MDGYMLFWILIVIILAAGVGAGLIAEAIRNKDFQDQISGKKPERKPDPNEKVSYDKEVIRSENTSNIFRG